MTQTAKREMTYEQVLSRKVVSERYTVYTVLSSSGKETYDVTLSDGHATGCTCPARQRCYHCDGAEVRERFEQWWEQPLSVEEQVAEGEMVAEVVLGEDAAQHIADELTPEEYDDLADLIDETPAEHLAYRVKLAAEMAECEAARRRRMSAPLTSNSGFRFMA